MQACNTALKRMLKDTVHDALGTPPPVEKVCKHGLPDGRGEHFRNYGYLKLTIPYKVHAYFL